MQTLRLLDPNATVSFRSLANQVAESMWLERLLAIVGSYFGLVSLFVASVGVAGMVWYSCELRYREIALRLALGASPARAASAIHWRLLTIGAFATMGGLAGGLAPRSIILDCALWGCQLTY